MDILGSFVSLVRNTRYPVNTEAYEIIKYLSFIPIVIILIKYIKCYKIIKGKDINLFLYSIIPLTFVLSFRYIILILLPLMILNMFIIKYLNLETNFWNIINIEIINIIMNIFLAVHFIKYMKNIYKNNTGNTIN
ncbi:MAG: hypothetical protein LBU83_06055, partial [Bacteroidales bacterium]|nr:hypothetical protein [Bacteroidales bacterium]